MRKFILSIFFMCLCFGYNTIAQEGHVIDQETYEISKEEDSDLSVAIPLPSTWYICNIHKVKITTATSKLLVKLSDRDGSFVNRWFYLHSSLTDRGLPMALSAIENNKKVEVRLSSTNQYSTSNRFIIRK